VFERRRRPLKIGIVEDTVAAAPDLDRSALFQALGYYTGNRYYLEGLRTGAARIDLAGAAVDTVSAEHAAFAAERIAKRKPRKVKQAPAAPSKAGITALRAAARARAARGRT
jgi:ProP effector